MRRTDFYEDKIVGGRTDGRVVVLSRFRNEFSATINTNRKQSANLLRESLPVCYEILRLTTNTKHMGLGSNIQGFRILQTLSSSALNI